MQRHSQAEIVIINPEDQHQDRMLSLHQIKNDQQYFDRITVKEKTFLNGGHSSSASMSDISPRE